MDIVGLGAQNWDPSPGVGVEEGVHEILETYPLDGHSQVEAAGLVDMHPGMKKKYRFNSKDLSIFSCEDFSSGNVLPFNSTHLDLSLAKLNTSKYYGRKLLM